MNTKKEKKIITRIKKKTEFVMDNLEDENFSEEEGEFQKSKNFIGSSFS